MIDITGGGIVDAEKKSKLSKLSKWIQKQKLEKFALKAFVLAPGARMENKLDGLGNAIIGQDEALTHLGGLQQICRWFLDKE